MKKDGVVTSRESARRLRYGVFRFETLLTGIGIFVFGVALLYFCIRNRTPIGSLSGLVFVIMGPFLIFRGITQPGYIEITDSGISINGMPGFKIAETKRDLNWLEIVDVEECRFRGARAIRFHLVREASVDTNAVSTFKRHRGPTTKDPVAQAVAELQSSIDEHRQSGRSID
jgi:hypothetical protein